MFPVHVILIQQLLTLLKNLPPPLYIVSVWVCVRFSTFRTEHFTGVLNLDGFSPFVFVPPFFVKKDSHWFSVSKTLICIIMVVPCLLVHLQHCWLEKEVSVPMLILLIHYLYKQNLFLMLIPLRNYCWLTTYGTHFLFHEGKLKRLTDNTF